MKLTAHQPVYLPWLGLFHKIYLADEFCLFDIVQYQTKDFNNRNKIKTNDGSIWLSVPVDSKDHLNKKINEIKIVNNGWNKKHFKSISLAYKKSNYFNHYIDEIENILLKNDYENLTDLNFAFLKFGINALNIGTKIKIASNYSFEGTKSKLVLDMCKKLGANEYLFGIQGKDYADIDEFNENKVIPYFQEYIHPEYNQLHGQFIPNMSFIDLLFNEGPNSQEIFLRGNISTI